ncbi:MAG: T9SS type A sorting domain-containing protein, partial [Leadbetterella sp.]
VDGKIIMKNLARSTHYQVIVGNNPVFDFSKAIPINSVIKTFEIGNIPNPPKGTNYNIRVWNAKSTCYTDQVVFVDHINFVKNRDFVNVEVIQAVDISTPKIGDIVTFTTFVRNSGNKKSDEITVNCIQTQSLTYINHYQERGTFSSGGNVWQIGRIEGGKSIKLVVRFRVQSPGLSYWSSYIAKEGNKSFSFSDAQAFGIDKAKRSATNCCTVPVAINSNEVYTISLKQYKGVKWYFKDRSGNFQEITKRTNPLIAEISKDSTLIIRSKGEYSFSKVVDKCNVTSCCPIIVEGCTGPPIILDSVYCNSSVDSYNIIVHLEDDKYNVMEKVIYAMSNINLPMLSSYLGRVNALPLQSSSGFVNSLGNGYYKISNIPAFMPNVTLTSTDIAGKCRNTRIISAPNCTERQLTVPTLVESIQFKSEDEKSPNFKLASMEEDAEAIWSNDEQSSDIISKGRKFRPKTEGVYYVAFRDKETKRVGPSAKLELKLTSSVAPGKFDEKETCGCDNPLMLPYNDSGEITLINAFPNPVSDILTVEYRLPEKTRAAELYFTNVNGKTMKTFPLKDKNNQVKVKTNSWDDGLYFYSLIVDGIRTVNQRIVVLHD